MNRLLWSVLVLWLLAAKVQAQPCDAKAIASALQGLGNLDDCMQASVLSSAAARGIWHTRAPIKDPGLDVVENLRRLSIVMSQDSELPAELVRAWHGHLEAELVPLMKGMIREPAKPTDTPSPLTFNQTVGTVEKACGCAWSIGAGAPGPVVCVVTQPPTESCKESYTFKVPATAAIDRLFTYARLIHHALVVLQRPDRFEVVQRLYRTRIQWDRLLSRGYTQFPWELAANSAVADHRESRLCKQGYSGACSAAQLDPFALQLIVAHPSAGLGFRGFGADFDPRAKAVVVLNVETIGVLRYCKDFKQYYGGSFSVSMADLDFADPLLGATVHVTRWIHIGYGVSVRKKTRAEGTLFAVADLFGLLSKWFETDESK
jgi:hypothetical protein